VGRCVVLCFGNAIVWERVAVISAKDSFCILLYRTRFIYLFIILEHTLFAFVNVFGTIDSFVAGRARTCVRAIYRTCVAYSVGMTRVGRARVVQMAQKTCGNAGNS